MPESVLTWFEACLHTYRLVWSMPGCAQIGVESFCFPRKKAWLQPVATSRGVLPAQFMCPRCQLFFVDMRMLKKHHIDVHVIPLKPLLLNLRLIFELGLNCLSMLRWNLGKIHALELALRGCIVFFMGCFSLMQGIGALFGSARRNRSGALSVLVLVAFCFCCSKSNTIHDGWLSECHAGSGGGSLWAYGRGPSWWRGECFANGWPVAGGGDGPGANWRERGSISGFLGGSSFPSSGSGGAFASDSENWGHWRPIAADPVELGDSDVPRITPVDTTQPPPIPGQHLTALHHALLFDMRRRIAEAAELGVHLYPEPGEPMPQLSHYYGPPADPSSIYDSLAMAGTIGEAYVVQQLGSPAITRQIFGGSATLVRPSEYAVPTPWHSVLPRFPEGPHPPQVLPEPVQEEGRRPKRFREVATSTVDQDLAAEERLHLLLQGKGLFEWGLRPHDVLSAIDRLGAVTKGAGGRNDRRERECSISAMGYLQQLLICLRAFISAKAGERPLLALHEPRLFEGTALYAVSRRTGRMGRAHYEFEASNGCCFKVEGGQQCPQGSARFAQEVEAEGPCWSWWVYIRRFELHLHFGRRRPPWRRPRRGVEILLEVPGGQCLSPRGPLPPYARDGTTTDGEASRNGWSRSSSSTNGSANFGCNTTTGTCPWSHLLRLQQPRLGIPSAAFFLVLDRQARSTRSFFRHRHRR